MAKFPATLFLGSVALVVPSYTQAPSSAHNPSQISIRDVRKVYLTGSATKDVKYAQKHLAHYTCIEPVATISDADAILDFENDEDRSEPLHVDRVYDPNPVVTCRSNSTTTSCSDTNGITERVTCATAANGDVICRASYTDVGGAITGTTNALLLLISTIKTPHLYIVNKDTRQVIWEQHQGVIGQLPWWEDLRDAASCRKHERADKPHGKQR